jgi:sulfotransferase famil protein
MLILNSRRVIYIHIHKTGGETVEHVLGKLGAWNDLMLASEHPGTSDDFKRRFGLTKHSTALQVAKLVGMDVWNSYFSWATIRNPYERVASLYGFVASMSEPHLSHIGFPLGGSAEEQRKWVESAEYPLRDHWIFAAVRAYVATRGSQSAFSEFLRHPMLQTNEPAYRTQFSRLSDAGGDALLVTRVVKLELLASAWPDLCREMGIPPTKLPVRNATPNKWKRSVGELFTKPADLELINTIYSEDFRRFDYETVGPDPVPRVIAGSDLDAKM